MTSEVLHNHEEATYITVETVSFYGVKAEPENVTVNSQEALFTYRDNKVIYFNIVFKKVLVINTLTIAHVFAVSLNIENLNMFSTFISSYLILYKLLLGYAENNLEYLSVVY